MKAPAVPGTYFLVEDLSAARARAIRGERLRPKHRDPDYLLKVEVRGEPRPMELPTDEELRPFAPHSPVRPEEVVAHRRLEFFIDKDARRFEIDGHEFRPGHTDHTARLGTAEEWVLTSRADAHPFHIHVNPFELLRIYNPETSEEIPTERLWRDTLLVEEGLEYTIRMRFEDFAGKTVLHCHVLDHEDQGMMQSLEIVRRVRKGPTGGP